MVGPKDRETNGRDSLQKLHGVQTGPNFVNAETLRFPNVPNF